MSAMRSVCATSLPNATVSCSLYVRSSLSRVLPTPVELITNLLTFIIMAKLYMEDGIHAMTGRISRDSRLVSRVKHFRDPLTGEVVQTGPNEYYHQDRRDYVRHPLTPGEQKQKARWTAACRMASEIVRDRSHPRYMSLYARWRDQLQSAKPITQFPNFVRSVLAAE